MMKLGYEYQPLACLVWMIEDIFIENAFLLAQVVKNNNSRAYYITNIKFTRSKHCGPARMRSMVNVHRCGVHCKNDGSAKQNDPAALKQISCSF